MYQIGVNRNAHPEFDANVDVIIIGAGAAGLIAGLAASAWSRAVVVLEREDRVHGSTALSAGLIPAAWTRWQRDSGIDDSAELFTNDILAKSKCVGDYAVAHRLCTQSSKTLHWLADQWQVPLTLVDGFTYPGHSVRRMHATPRRTGDEFVACLLDAVQRTDVNLVTAAHAFELLVTSDTVVGVVVARGDGQIECIGAKAVILACNGYGANPELVRRHIPSMGDCLYFGHTGNTGDAVVWAERLELSLKHLGAYQGHASVAKPHGILISWAVMMEGGIQVNTNAERFSNELDGYSEQAERVIAQPAAIAWNIFDQRIFDIAAQFEDFRLAVEAGAVIKADSISGLADAAGLPAKKLEETFSEVRLLQRRDLSDQWGRRFTEGQRLTPPYYGVRVEAALFHTQGGIEVDSTARVLRNNGSRHDNLFAVGGAAVGVSGPSASGYLSGNGLLTAVTLGQTAGHEAGQWVARMNASAIDS